MKTVVKLICVLILIIAAAPVSIAQSVTIKITADNYFAVYTGNSTSASTKHFDGAWGNGVSQQIIPTNDAFLYVAAWDDGNVFQGLLASVASGSGYVTTGSPLWSVCATNQPIAGDETNAPSAGGLSAHIAACTVNASWHPASVGPNNGNASANLVNNINLWGPTGQIDLTAAWIWDTNCGTACAGMYGFLDGRCDPGEFLIFRLPLEAVRTCLPPVPSFVITSAAVCDTLVADGSASQNEANYFWSIQEADAFGNPVGPEAMGWFAGQAGSFDLKAFYQTATGKPLKCDTNYRVKLAVANRCVSWVSSPVKLVKMKCCAAPATDTMATGM